MKPLNDTTEEFKADLISLLRKYKASISIEDQWKGFAECGEDLHIIVDIDYEYDSQNNVIVEGGTIDFGRYITFNNVD